MNVSQSRQPPAPPVTPPGRLRVPKAAELVATKIQRSIVRGELREGDALPTESELMRAFAISRPTLREALRVLESQSMITVHRGSRGGARVSVPKLAVAAEYAGLVLQTSNTTVADVLAARLVLEVGAVRMLAEAQSQDFLPKLREVLSVEGESLDDIDDFRRAATEIHRALVDATGNKSMSLLYTMLENITARHAEAATAHLQGHSGKRPAWRTKSHAVHIDIVDRIAGRDADGAARLWRAHVRESNRATSQQVGIESVLDLFD